MKTPINNGILQSDFDFAGFQPLNLVLPASVARKFDVKTYGAEGDGVTDDTTAIQNALADIPSTGGVLYFPAGQYVYSGVTLVLDRRITVEGDGGGIEAISLTDLLANTLSISTIDFDSDTGTLFDVQAHGCAFKNIQLRNTHSTAPTAGAGILVSANGDRTNYTGLTVNGFYINIDVQAGWMQNFHDCYIVAPVLYGLKLSHTAHIDYGDHSITNCQFLTARSRAATSAIRIESGGGIKIANTKINSMAVMAYPWVNGIDLAVASNVATSDLIVTGCSIENFSAIGIKGTTGVASSFWGNIVITGNQISPIIANNQYAINLTATTAGDFNGVSIVGNLATISSSANPAIYLEKCSNVAMAGNMHAGFSDAVVIGASVTFARSATIPPGGTTGQSLKKLSNANYDVGWA